MIETFASARCELGEGPLVHAGRLFWFDILNKRLHACGGAGQAVETWQFPIHYSAAGRLRDGRLLLASERGLHLFDPARGGQTDLCPLEADDGRTRSNDGRADRQGGFWIGTMGKSAEPGAGAIYRYHRGEIRKLFPEITIPNAICFAPDGRRAYFADSAKAEVYACALDAEGWPAARPERFLDFSGRAGAPDGAVVDSEGALWLALWEAGEVARFGPDGALLDRIELPASRPTCPAFGGDDLRTLFVTTAQEGMTEAQRAAEPGAGCVYAARIAVPGIEEAYVDVAP